MSVKLTLLYEPYRGIDEERARKRKRVNSVPVARQYEKTRIKLQGGLVLLSKNMWKKKAFYGSEMCKISSYRSLKVRKRFEYTALRLRNLLYALFHRFARSKQFFN